MTEHTSSTIEDYLLNIYTMTSDGRAVIAARLAEALNVAPPTVTAGLQRMLRDGLITVNRHKEVALTPIGHERAETMVRRHRLAECLLVDILGLDWVDAHEEAHRFEHAISPRVEERILAVLHRPTTCPHGSPIPGTGAAPVADAFRLDAAEPTQRVVVLRISEEAERDRALLAYFQQAGLLPGHELEVARIETSNSLMILRINGATVPVSLNAAHTIWVRRSVSATATAAA
jgi:DtxR family Mn-dependent transcriptional regulator